MDDLELIKTAIQDKGLSQIEIADKAGVAVGTLNRILNGKQILKPNTNLLNEVGIYI